MASYEITAVFVARLSGACVVDSSHVVKRGDKVGKVQRADNPFLVVTGVACKNCVRTLPRAEG